MTLTLGLDIGSTTSKCVLLEDGRAVVASTVVAAGIGTKGAQQAVEEVLTAARVTASELAGFAVTGYGRNTWPGDCLTVSELTCHALGAHQVLPEARTVIDIGGQDSKAIVLDEDGRMESFQMNDKCAAGTGRFLEVMVHALQLSFEEFDRLARSAGDRVAISSTCTVFAESEVISQLAAGKAVDAVTAGIAASIGGRTATLARRVGVRERVCMSGGVAQSEAVRAGVAEALATEVLYSPFAQCFGALGAAVYASERRDDAGGKEGKEASGPQFGQIQAQLHCGATLSRGVGCQAAG